MRRNLDFLFIGMGIGVLGGILIGLLFAPQSGAKTRRLLVDEATRAAERARVIAERAEDAAEALGDRVDHYLGREQEVAWRKVKEIREGMQAYTQAQGS